MYSRPNFAHRPARRRLSQFPAAKGKVLAYGFTLVELLVALALTLILMITVVKVFGDVGTSMRNARRALEQFDRLRTAAQQLNSDMNGITARLDGRAGRPEEGLGYFELIEGSYLHNLAAANATPYYGVNDKNVADYTVGERGDILMFTSRNAARPFVGRFGKDISGNPQTIQSDVAEVSWFLRGNRLHRRVLLIVPGAASAVAGYDPKQFYNDYDLSAHRVKNANGQTVIVPNSIADLVKRENRFGHDARQFPYDVRGWGSYGLPTLAECTSSWINNWATGSTPAPTTGPTVQADLWNISPGPTNPLSLNAPVSTNLSDQALVPTGGTVQRASDDVILTNVIGFDVKVWEPAANGGAGGYVDLGAKYNNNGTATGFQGSPVTIVPNKQPPNQPYTYAPSLGPTSPRFIDMSANNIYYGCQSGIVESGLSPSSTYPQCVYDSGCFSYANELGNGQATNGLDDDNTGVVDVLGEYVMNSGPPALVGKAPGVSPYPVPLRGIQITIRCFEPDSKQIREITIEHDFLPK